MDQEKYVFTQIVEYISHYDFDKCVATYQGNRRVRELFCRDQFLAMMFGQLCHRESLRDLVVSLKAHSSKLYRLGFRSEIELSSLARANENRDYRIYEELAKLLITKAQSYYLTDAEFPFKLKGNFYLIDSSTIDLCLSIFQWAKFRATKSAVKIHTQIDGKGIIPTVIDITEGAVHDVRFLDKINFELGAYYVMDRGYLDYGRLFKIATAGAFFVIRAKSNLAFKRQHSSQIDKTTGIRSDQVIKFTTYTARKSYPAKLRRMRYIDDETNVHYTFLTNDLNSEAKTIADMYKYRWQIELFFKWIKQHLKVQTFWGRSANAVKVQIYIAICTYLLVLIMKKDLKIEMETYKILQIFSISLLDKVPVKSLFVDLSLQALDFNVSEQLSLLGP